MFFFDQETFTLWYCEWPQGETGEEIVFRVCNNNGVSKTVTKCALIFLLVDCWSLRKCEHPVLFFWGKEPEILKLEETMFLFPVDLCGLRAIIPLVAAMVGIPPIRVQQKHRNDLCAA